MIRALLAVLLLAWWFVPPSRGQIPVIPSIPVAQTKVPVFAAGPGEHPQELANFRLHLEFQLPEAGSALALRLNPRRTLEWKGGGPAGWQTLELRYEQLPGRNASFSATLNGRPVAENERIPEPAVATNGALGGLRLDGDFTAVVAFAARGDGALVAKCDPAKWEPGAKMLGLRGGRLFYDIGWLGVATGKTAGLADGNPHTAVIRSEAGRVTLFVDGKLEAARAQHTKPDREGHRFLVARGAQGFVGDLLDGEVAGLRFWKRALRPAEAEALSSGKTLSGAGPDCEWKLPPGIATFPQGIPGTPTKIALQASGGAAIRNGWVQPLAAADHAKIIGRWSEESLAEGSKIYNTLCMTCHGTLTQEGSLPTSRHFQREPFKNGNDPFRMYQTLTQGYGLMMPMPQYTAEQKYALVHYIRETFVAPLNRSELFPLTPDYLESLPVGMRTLPKATRQADDSQQYERMNFGPAMEWTFEVAPDNIAYKGIAVRLDPGEGGVSKGHAWLVFDHDTLRLATVATGSFMDWKNVAFDGSHGTHCRLTGDRLFANPVGPGWANPLTGTWEDPRTRGRDGKPYGPLPKEWCRYRGAYLHGSRVVQSYQVGDAAVLEAGEIFELGKFPLFLRTLNLDRSTRDLKLRLAPEADGVQTRLLGASFGKPEMEGGFQVLRIPASATPVRFRIAMTKGLDEASLGAVAQHAELPLDLSTLVRGGPARWKEVVKTQGIPGKEEGPFAADVLTHPESDQNPWQSWMRLTGFDFLPGGDRAAVCTWMGDVWLVDGVARQPVGELKWQRIATGLFQPLGLKYVDGAIFVTCRDQIAKLHDLNGDGETDFVECFNNDQQVTEHFHEFAMGLQTDAAGNFYYAKSARHALPALVPQHGTLLRVSADGSRTDILASGFRAANGVCVNPDGTFFVTDQEGHWTPKNRINLVRGKGPGEFFGNMMGYHAVTDESDNAMLPPVCWITNAMDRSPAELVWVPRNAGWGPLNGALLNLSYGYGKIYSVPMEEVNGVHQGGVCELPLPPFPTGVMRGRFHPQDGQLYTCGMFAWAGNQTQPGGFYRVRFTGKPAWQPVGLQFRQGKVRVRFSDPLPPGAAELAGYALKAWSLKRTANYGSPHVDEHPLPVAGVELADSCSICLAVPALHPTMGLEVACRFRASDGAEVKRVIHGTIHTLPPE